MKLVAIDPGKGTGFAIFDTDVDGFDAYEYEYAEVMPALQDVIWKARDYFDLIHVVCEKYVMTSGLKSPQPEALMHMGAIEWICRSEGVPLTWQFPGPAKSMVPDARLRQLGWHQKTKDGHANDAARHVLLWLAHNDTERYARMIGI